MIIEIIYHEEKDVNNKKIFSFTFTEFNRFIRKTLKMESSSTDTDKSCSFQHEVESMISGNDLEYGSSYVDG